MDAVEASSILHHICIIRADLPHRVQIAQTIHAAGESAQGMVVPPNTHAIAKQAANEEELLELEAKLILAGIEFVAIREPDEPWNGQLMVIGLKPQIRTKEIKKLLGRYKLVE